jgi:hypothetical protein
MCHGTTSIEQHDAADPTITNNEVAPTSEQHEWPATTLCEANNATQGESIFDLNEQVGRATNAHRRMGGKQPATLWAESEASLEFTRGLFYGAPWRINHDDHQGL